MQTRTLFGSLVVLSFAVNARAAVVAWDGPPVGGAWSVGSNWSNDLVPGAGDSITIGNNSQVTSTTAITLNNENPGNLLIQFGSSLQLNNTSITLEQSPSLVTIQGALILSGSSSIISHSEVAGTAGSFRLNGGTMAIGDWNNSIRSFNLANAPTVDFRQLGDTISVAGISAGAEQTNYVSKFEVALPQAFFGIDGTNVSFTATATGAESQEINGKRLIRIDDFANGASVLMLVPEPSSVLLSGLGLLALLRRRR